MSLVLKYISDTALQSLDNIGLILGALTAGGGITGYVRTGSVPSVAAGVSVGTLVRYDSLPAIAVIALTLQIVHSRRPPHPQCPALRRRTRPPRIHRARWKFVSSCTEDSEAATHRIEFVGRVWSVCLWIRMVQPC